MSRISMTTSSRRLGKGSRRNGRWARVRAGVPVLVLALVRALAPVLLRAVALVRGLTEVGAVL
jgi:hypothetical protein